VYTYTYPIGKRTYFIIYFTGKCIYLLQVHSLTLLLTNMGRLNFYKLLFTPYVVNLRFNSIIYYMTLYILILLL